MRWRGCSRTPTGPRWTSSRSRDAGTRISPRSWVNDRIAAAFAGNGKLAALMPYLMGGYPTLDESRAIGLACADAGADLVELGVPFSDPLADGPVIHAAGTAALGGGGTPPLGVRGCAPGAGGKPPGLVGHADPLLRHDPLVPKGPPA